MKVTIRTIDIFEEDPTGDRYAHLNDVINYINESDLDPPELISDLRRLFEPVPGEPGRCDAL